MHIQVKICGLATPETIDAALGAGADLVGLVHFPRSPRHVSPERAAELAARVRGRAQVVCLLVDPDDELAQRIATVVRPDLLQLHGAETPQRVHLIRTMTGLPVIKAIKVATGQDARAADAYRESADVLLFDAKEPPGATAKLPGGNGIPFDWRALEGMADKGPFMLSGGLTPGNVAEAIRLTRAPMVDVSSGVEIRPGVKDPSRIESFIAAVRAAEQPLSAQQGAKP